MPQQEQVERLPDVRYAVVAGIPAFVAIGVFGALYGATARPLIGPELTLAMSFLVFSGAAQFATIALVSAGAGPAAILATVLTLNLRHVVMGAVLRPWLSGSRLHRALLAFFMLDETFGFTVASAERVPPGEARSRVAERTLLATGLFCYASWLIGTAFGILGAGYPGLEKVATAVFPVLFIGLAALAARNRSMGVRALIAAVLTALICVTLPDVRALSPVVAGLIVALPGDHGA